MHAFSQTKGKSLTRDFVREVKSLRYGMVKKTSAQRPYSGNYKNFFTVKVNVQNFILLFIFFVSLNVVGLFYVTFI